MGGLEGPPKPPERSGRPGEPVAPLDPRRSGRPGNPWRPSTPSVRRAPAEPWRSSTIRSAQELADLPEGFGVRAAEELEDDRLRRRDHGAGLTRLRQAEIHARRAPRADRVGHDRDADTAAEQVQRREQ